jgi:hypothetical protein
MDRPYMGRKELKMNDPKTVLVGGVPVPAVAHEGVIQEIMKLGYTREEAEFFVSDQPLTK